MSKLNQKALAQHWRWVQMSNLLDLLYRQAVDRWWRGCFTKGTASQDEIVFSHSSFVCLWHPITHKQEKSLARVPPERVCSSFHKQKVYPRYLPLLQRVGEASQGKSGAEHSCSELSNQTALQDTSLFIHSWVCTDLTPPCYKSGRALANMTYHREN